MSTQPSPPPADRHATAAGEDVSEGRIALLQRMPIFGAVRADILRLLLELSRLVRVGRQEFFFREGDPADCMYVLESGRAEVLKRWKGEQAWLHSLEQGDCFGEMALMDLFPRSASVRAIEDCTAIELPVASLYRISERDLEQFALIEMNMGREISRRLRESDERLFRTVMLTDEKGEPKRG
ncbi:MAG TPA: cyclic nucleotide-binding domain-containing protein [Burkholderiaceae bacterium]